MGFQTIEHTQATATSIDLNKIGLPVIQSFADNGFDLTTRQGVASFTHNKSVEGRYRRYSVQVVAQKDNKFDLTLTLDTATKGSEKGGIQVVNIKAVDKKILEVAANVKLISIVGQETIEGFNKNIDQFEGLTKKKS